MSSISFNMRTIAQAFETHCVKPLAQQMANKAKWLKASQKEELRQVLEYDIKAHTFNLATLCGALATISFLARQKWTAAAFSAATGLFIREIANHSLALTISRSLTDIWNRARAYLQNVGRDENWRPDYLTFGEVVILKNPSIALNQELKLLKDALFHK